MNRMPAVAGSFYPANADQLRQQVHAYLIRAHSGTRVPKALIAPHAGLVYSGAIAASAYARLEPAFDTINRVVLLGPSHRVAFKGLALTQADTYVTPLGAIPIDHTIEPILADLAYVGILEQAHTHEHSLELQLPFLQQQLANFSLIPIVTGDATPEQVGTVLERLWGGPETLIVISSDLSHYHNYETAQKLDKATSVTIEKLQYERLDYESACGRVPISGLLKLARDKNLSVKTIDLRNSGDTGGDKRRVVGYGAYVID